MIYVVNISCLLSWPESIWLIFIHISRISATDFCRLSWHVKRHGYLSIDYGVKKCLFWSNMNFGFHSSTVDATTGAEDIGDQNAKNWAAGYYVLFGAYLCCLDSWLFIVAYREWFTSLELFLDEFCLWCRGNKATPITTKCRYLY